MPEVPDIFASGEMQACNAPIVVLADVAQDPHPKLSED